MKRTMKVLVIEDDPNIYELLKLYIEREGFTSLGAETGDEGLALYYDENPDFILLDIMLPERNGWEICQEIRRDNASIPIIMLTGKGEGYDKIRGLELGADDYMVKPFDPNELMARMKAVWRRTHPKDSRESVQLTNLTINLMEYKVFYNQEELIMPPKEIELLYFLASNPNQVFTRQQLLDKVWGFDFDGDPRTIDVHIKRIREKIGEDAAIWMLKTIRGIGYKFEVKTFV